MIHSVKVTNHRGESIVFELEKPALSGFSVLNILGLGPVKSIINTNQSLYLDGSYFNSARLSERNIVLDLGFEETPDRSIELIRLDSYRFFPQKVPIILEFTTDSRKASIVGFVESNEPDIFSSKETTKISVLCPNPYFSEGSIITTLFTGVNPTFEFPWENPSLTLKLIEFGQIFVNTIANVFYTGETPTGVVIIISFSGAVTDPIIHNTITGENMALSSTKMTALTGFNFKAGDVVTISTIPGNKYIRLLRDGVESNILNVVDVLSDWFQIQKGDNLFTYTATSGLANMLFTIQHQVIYEAL